jgi:hypothetical protein
MPAVAELLVGPPKRDRSKGRSQTKRDTLVLQVGGWVQGQQLRPGKNPIPLKMLNYGKPDGRIIDDQSEYQGIP